MIGKGDANSRLTLLLPPWEVLARQNDASLLAHARLRGDALAPAASGRRAQQQRQFDIAPKPPAWAAITRAMDCGDAAGQLWLRADPAHIQIEAGGLRLLAFGEALALDSAETAALAATVRPVFHDLGMVFSAPSPHRWYVALARGRPMPPLLDPESALGVEGSCLAASAAAPREWMRILNETQMALHAHPVNASRARRGVAIVNSLWLWGAGELPLKVSGQHTAIVAADTEYAALAKLARVQAFPGIAEALGSRSASLLVDARHAPRTGLLKESLAALAAGHVNTLRLDAEDGVVVDCRLWHRFRFWRRASTPLT